MLSRRAAAQLDYGLYALNAAQIMDACGLDDESEHVPRPGEVTLRDLAAYTGLSYGAIQGFYATARAKFITGLIDNGVPSDVAAALAAYLDRNGLSEL